MKYMGSKMRIAKHILPIILEHHGASKVYVEPFVGGANLIDNITGDRIGSDLNETVIQALSSIKYHLDQLPRNNQEFTEEDYKEARNNLDYPHRSYIGYALSYGGKFFGGWRRDKEYRRDYIKEAYKSACKQSPKLQTIALFVSDYKNLVIPDNSTIYCDPPYKNTTSYKTSTFDHQAFYQWCRTKRDQGHTIYVSEYTAPDDFQCVWQKEISSSLTKDTGSKKAMEKLFTLP